MSTVAANDMNDFLAAEMKHFQSQLNGEVSAPINCIRKEAFDRFNELGFPTMRHEEWKYTNLGQILNQQYELARASFLPEDFFNQRPFADIPANIVVFVNGFYSTEYSTIIDDVSSIGIHSIAKLRMEKSELLTAHFSQYAPYTNDALTALNTAFLLEDNRITDAATNTAIN